MVSGSKALRRFNHLLNETQAAYRETAAALGLSDSVMRILYALWDSDGRCPLREVCRQAGVTKQTINSALRRLEADGLVRLERAGGRNKDVCLTERGTELAGRTVARIIAAENAVLAAWTAQEVEAYLSLTEKYLTGFRAKTQELLRGVDPAPPPGGKI